MQHPYQIKSIGQYHEARRKSAEDPEAFWEEIAAHFRWKKPWEKILSWNFDEPSVKWFEGAQLNITESCLDRHLETRGNEPAIIWEPNDPEKPGRVLSYSELHLEVCRFARVLQRNGVHRGDRVCLYMGMVPELAIAMLACARIGAIHSVIFGGFSARSIADRLEDADATCIVTADGAFRGPKSISLKPLIDEALEGNERVKTVIVLEHTREPVSMLAGRDIWWQEEMKAVLAEGLREFPAESMEAEDPLFILYTSGSTGKPKGVLHTCAGYMVWANYTFVNVFQYRSGQVHLCTADLGWITGHSYVLYGPLSAGACTVIFEGIPTWPDAGRFWEICEKHEVNILYTAPTAIRSLMGFGKTPFEGKNLNSLKVLGSVGEPINEEAWHWYHREVGRENCPVVDTWWQTETGGILISNLAGVTPQRPAWATLPLPGVFPCLVDDQGRELEGAGSGNLCLKFPWPGMLRSTWGDHERCRQTYFAPYPGKYFTGDGCIRDEYGNYRITGRVDDVLNVSGHRIGTAELENALNMHSGVIESAVVGYPHDLKGQGIYAFVHYQGAHASEEDRVRQDLLLTVSKLIGPIAKPDKIQFVPGLPKTRSGKIMRRILRKIAEGDAENLGDTSTLLDPAIPSIIQDRYIP
jgi:acetyl-CoA synthetase